MKTKTSEMAEVEPFPSEISAGRYSVRIAQTQNEIESALRLRYEVFNIELKGSKNSLGLEFDEFDFNCNHLIVVEKTSRRTVGTYRLNSIETVGVIEGFYSYDEFSIEDLPPDVLTSAVETDRAVQFLWLDRTLRKIGRRSEFGDIKSKTFLGETEIQTSHGIDGKRLFVEQFCVSRKSKKLSSIV